MPGVRKDNVADKVSPKRADENKAEKCSSSKSVCS